MGVPCAEVRWIKTSEQKPSGLGLEGGGGGVSLRLLAAEVMSDGKRCVGEVDWTGSRFCANGRQIDDPEYWAEMPAGPKEQRV